MAVYFIPYKFSLIKVILELNIQEKIIERDKKGTSTYSRTNCAKRWAKYMLQIVENKDETEG